MNEKIGSPEGKLIVPCQALLHEPSHPAFVIDRMVPAAKEGGTYGIRTNTKEGIAEIRTQVDLPVINIMKRDYEGNRVYVTSTMKEINKLMEAELETTAPDATGDLKPGGRTLDEFHKGIRKSYLGQLLMTDCSAMEGALYADQLGSNFIGTTLVRYTNQNRNLKIESSDSEITRRIVATVEHRVITEGDTSTPEKAKRVVELGVSSVVAGSIVTRPQLITKSFAQALN